VVAGSLLGGDVGGACWGGEVGSGGCFAGVWEGACRGGVKGWPSGADGGWESNEGCVAVLGCCAVLQGRRAVG